MGIEDKKSSFEHGREEAEKSQQKTEAGEVTIFTKAGKNGESEVLQNKLSVDFASSQEFKTFWDRNWPEIEKGLSVTRSRYIDIYSELPNNVVQMPEMEQAVKSYFVNKLSSGWVPDNFFEDLKVADRLYSGLSNSPEFQEAAQKGFIKIIDGYYNLEGNKLRFIQSFDFPASFLQSQEIQGKAEKCLSELLLKSKDGAGKAKILVEVTKMPVDRARIIGIEVINNSLSELSERRYDSHDSHPDPVFRIRVLQEAFGITEEDLRLSEKVPRAINNVLEKPNKSNWAYNFFEDITRIIKDHHVPLQIGSEWEELANRRAVNLFKDFPKGDHEVLELRRLLNFMREVRIPITSKRIEQSLELDVEKVRGYIELLRNSTYYPRDRVDNVANTYKENPSKEIEEAAINSMIAQGIEGALVIQGELKLPAKIIQQSLELQSFLRETFSKFNHDYVKRLITAIAVFPLPGDFWQTPEIQNTLKELWDNETSLPGNRFEADFTSSLINKHLQVLVKKVFPDPEIFTADEGVQAKAKALINTAVNYYSPKVLLAADIASFFQIDKSDPVIQALLPKIKEGIIKIIKENVIDHVSVAHTKSLCEDAFRAREVFGFDKELGQDLGKEGMVKAIAWGYLEGAKVIKDTFGFPDSVIADLFKVAKEKRNYDGLIKLASHFPACEELYKNFINDCREVISKPHDARERKEAIKVFAGLVLNGDTRFLQDLINIVSERGQDQTVQDTKTGFTPIQEAAFAVLYRLDMAESNNALYSLIHNKAVPPAVKRSTLTKLTEQNSSFLDEYSRVSLRHWLNGQELESINWDDLSFLRDIENIAASESREIAKLYASEVIAGFGSHSVYEIWKQQYPDIPKNTFLQLCKFLQTNSREEAWATYNGDIMEKFQALYKTLRKEGSKRDLLLSAVASCHNIQPELLDLVVEKLSDMNFEKKEDADKIARILKLTSFLNSIQNILSQGNYDEQGEYYEEEVSQPTLANNIKEIFLRATKDLSELENLLSSAATLQIQEILPNENITTEKVEKVIERWGDIEPVFTYLKRHPDLKNYIAEMFANFDSNENWKTWRYNLENRTVKRQVGHLSPEQLEIWQTDHAAEVGDFEIQEGSLGKPEQIRRLLVDAIVRDRHINNEQAGGAHFPLAQRILESTFSGLDENIEQDRKKLSESINKINDLASKLDILILSANSSRVEQTLSTILPPDKDLTPSSKIENSLKALRPFLLPEVFETIWKTYKDIPEKTAIPGRILISTDIRQALTVKLQDLRQEADEILKSPILPELGLPASPTLEISTIYQKRAELKAILDILRLSDLSQRQIAFNILVEGRKKDEGASITSTLENLKKVFKDNAFVQDIKNIEFILREQARFVGKRRLAMLLSDNPSFLWQAGKYPIGNGSCQHYAEGSMSQSLMGYVGDAHIKVAYLFDINSLPEHSKAKIKEGTPIVEIIEQAKPPEILQAVVARSMVKLGKDQQNKPSIFMEPTYSVINKGDISMDRYFNLFTDLFVAEPMKAKLCRGSGPEKLNIPASRNPEGQYEDGPVGNAEHAGMGIQTSNYRISAKLISKDYTPSVEEEKILENMRRSSQ